MNLLKALQIGDRKEIARSKDVANELLKQSSSLKSLFNILCDHSENAMIVSHGSYALKEASLQSSEIRRRTMAFFQKEIDRFDQWEARENFLRICLIELERSQSLFEKVLPMTKDSSAIVQSYASEYVIRYAHKYNPKSLESLLKDIERFAGRASVRARIKKIKKELKIL